jgi:hypothetical protein
VVEAVLAVAAEVVNGMRGLGYSDRLRDGPDIPQSLRSVLIGHLAATGTDPMKFRMRHG